MSLNFLFVETFKFLRKNEKNNIIESIIFNYIKWLING